MKLAYLKETNSMILIAMPIVTYNFDNFNMDLFDKEKIQGKDISPFDNMRNILSFAEGFVHNFKKDKTPNLLLFGSTGLGKTYLCSCVAKALIDKGHLVVYQTAFQ